MKTDLPIYSGSQTEQWQKLNLQSRIRALEATAAEMTSQISQILVKLEQLDKRLQTLEP